MSIVLHGIGLGGGIAIGNAYLLDKNLNDAVYRILDIEDVDAEILRFESALVQTKRELERLRDNIPSNAPKELGAFLSLSLIMLEDPQIAISPLKIIGDDKCNAEWAIKLQANKLSAQFDNIRDDYLKERKHDVIQILERVFENLEGNKFKWDEAGDLECGILATHDLSPVDLIHFKNSNFSGFITEVGSLTSHTAIVGRNLDIPAVIKVAYARQLIGDNELIIIDGIEGVLIINPDPIVLNEYKRRQEEWLNSKDRLYTIRQKEAITEDGVSVELLANIDNLNDLVDAKYNNASGVGLFRSEFLFLTHDDHIVNEDEQFEMYSTMLNEMGTLPITIRMADFGVDKIAKRDIGSEILNPALGLTGVRLLLATPSMLKTQLRAILRASVYGNIEVMFPMISSSIELQQVINQMHYVKEELKEEGIAYNPEIKIGAMIEVPAAAFAIKGILAIVDFVSIGTNDLIQYMLAVDRNDEVVNYLYNPTHPAILKIILHVIRQCNRVSVPVSICGEMAGDERLTRLLLGMGLRRFSMRSANILNIKQIILNTNLSQVTSTVNKILKTENFERIEELMLKLNSAK